MKKIETNFKQFCLDFFTKEDFSITVYKFYKMLKTTQTTKRDKFMTLTERRKASITYLVNNYGEQHLIECIDFYNDKVQKGEISINTIPYFNKVVENQFKKEKPTNYIPIKLSQKPLLKKIIPLLYKKVRTEYSDDFYNHNYICTNCKTEVTPWDTNCIQCKVEFEWGKVI